MEARKSLSQRAVARTEKGGKPRGPLYLKVLSGPHLGAEMDLAPGVYVLGSGDSCDVILSDATLAGRHVELTVSDHGVSARELDGGLLVDGERIQGGARDLAPFEIATIGTTHFAVGIQGEPWPELSLPSLVLAHAREEGGGEAGKDGAHYVGGEGDHGVGGDAEPEPPGGEAATGSRVRRPLVLAAVAVLVAGLALAMLFKGPGGPLNGETPPPPAGEAQIRALLANRGIAGLAVSGKDGRVAVSGYVGTAGERREIEALIRQSAPGAVSRIRDLETLAASAREILDLFRLPLAVTARGQGEIVVTGTVEDPAALDRALAALGSDVPGVLSVKDDTTPPGSEAKAPAAPERAPVPVFAAPPAPARPAAAAPAPPAAARVPEIPIAGVSLGPVPCITLKSGEKIFKGGSLAGRYLVMDITAERIVLSDGARIINYHLTGGK